MMLLTAGWERDWLTQLDLNEEGTAANFYSSILWTSVAALGLAQLRRSAPASMPPRLWMLGWLGLGFLALFVAVEDVTGLKDPAGASLPLVPGWLAEHDRWMVAVAPVAIPLAAAAGWNLLLSQREHPPRMLLTVLSIVLLGAALLHDLLHGVYKSSESAWGFLAEEGSEVVAAALLIVVLVDTLVSAEVVGRERPVFRIGRRTAVGIVLASLALSAHALQAKHQWPDAELPHAKFYAGPVSLISQPLQVKNDYVYRVDAWAFVEGGSAPAEVFARLTPRGRDQPVRESRTEVFGDRSNAEVISFEFDPIPGSKEEWYTLEIGILGGPLPWVFLGLTRVDAIPQSEAIVNGVPDGNDLALRTHSVASFGRLGLENGGARIILSAGIVLVVYLWLCALAITLRGLPSGWQRLRSDLVWDTTRTGALLTAGTVAAGITLISILSSR